MKYIFCPSDIIWPVAENKQGRTFFSEIGLSFPRSQGGRTVVCRAKRGQTVLLTEDQGKESPIKEKNVRPSLYFRYWPYFCLRTDTFFCLYGVCPTISPNLWIPLAWMLFMNAPSIYRVLQVAQASFKMENFAASKIFNQKRSLSNL